MKEYEVMITETLQKAVTVEAESREAAEALVSEQWNDSEYILCSEDFVDVTFQADEERELSQGVSKKMSVLLVSPEQYPKPVEIGTALADLQNAVGGNIEAVYPFDDEAALVTNVEGKINGLKLNRALRTEDGDTYDIVAGDFLVVGLGDENFASLTPEQMAHYEALFHQPEIFVKMGRGIMTIPMTDDMVKTAGGEGKPLDSRSKTQER